MRVYTAIRLTDDNFLQATSATEIAHFVGCSASYLRSQLKDGSARVKGCIIVRGEVVKVRRNGFNK